jgi:hypothetical protein
MAGSASLESNNWRRGITFGIPIAGAVWAIVELLLLHGDKGVDRYPWWSLLLASAVALLVFAILEAVGTHGPENRRKYGWIAIVIGADGRVSTSKVQAVLWTVLLAIAIAFLTGIVAFGPTSSTNLFDGVQWEQYLILLGGPFAAAVLAKVTVVAKLQNGTLQKVPTAAASAPPPKKTLVVDADAPTAPTTTGATDPAPAAPTQPKASDALSDDKGEIDLVDTQYLVFNIVVAVYAVVAYLGAIFSRSSPTRFALPDIPEVLLALTSLSAATYVGNKAAQRDAPRIVSMSPQPVTPGGDVDVLGVNLVPVGESGAAAANATSVMVEKLGADATEPKTAIVGVAPLPLPTASSVRFTMPTGFADSTVNVRVVTSAAVATDPFPVSVKAVV